MTIIESKISLAIQMLRLVTIILFSNTFFRCNEVICFTYNLLLLSALPKDSGRNRQENRRS